MDGEKFISFFTPFLHGQPRGDWRANSSPAGSSHGRLCPAREDRNSIGELEVGSMLRLGSHLSKVLEVKKKKKRFGIGRK
ncbi:hypothetical protein V6N12_035536 [Hibiscus sabdariffa]|uniref:Uncharacterized protein n=1 Tax=Hibiscus sabdariffa TaxID=183260 RepID=A0ABR2EPQ0_9ROSI